MKISNPTSRHKLKIAARSLVLDVGSGHNPHPRANVVTDKFIDSNFHRADNIKVLKKQRFVEADGERLPFQDKEFDYVICCHVVEHVDDPAKFLNELSRVGKMGYLEAPSLIGEFLIPKASHKWVLLELENKIIMVDKMRLGLTSSHDFGDVFLTFLPKVSFGYKIFQRTQPQIFTVNVEWKDSIDFIIEPEDKDLRKFFTQAWNKEMLDSILSKKSMVAEGLSAMGASLDIVKSVWQSKVLSK